MDKALVIGLTGGIASGKTTVAEMLRSLGASVIDADEIARVVVQPGTDCLARIQAQFGPKILTQSGHLDRKKLAQIVFHDRDARLRLNAIIHPVIRQYSQQQIESSKQQGHKIIIYEAALLVENRLYDTLDGLIVVSVPQSIQRDRLLAREDLTVAEAEARISSQLPLEAKAKVADYVIDNSGTTKQTRQQVIEIWQQLEQRLHQ